MKTKAKLTLAFSALSAVVLATAVTSTFAWFTTQSKATFATGTLTVSKVANIKIEVTKLGFVADETPASETDTEYVGAAATLGAVSTVDGRTFYAPTSLLGDNADYSTSGVFAEVGVASTSTGLVGKWTHGTGTSEEAYSNQYVGYVRYEIKVTAEQEAGTPRTLGVKVKKPTNGSGTALTGDLLSAYRISVAERTGAGTELSPYTYNPLPDKNVVYSNAGGNLLGMNSATNVAGSTVATTALASDVTVTTTHSTSAGIEAYYDVAAWVEGLAGTATNSLANATLKFGLEFTLN